MAPLFTYNYKNTIMNKYILTTEQRLRAIKILREELNLTGKNTQLHLTKGKKDDDRSKSTDRRATRRN